MDYQQLEELFHEALELSSTQRAAFLDEVAVRDTKLRRDLETLLRHACSGTMTCLRAPSGFISAAIDQVVDSHTGFTSSDAEATIPDRIDHYTIIRKIGSGGMGTVFHARDTKLDRPVALKLFHAHRSADSRQFLREARVTARCRHQNIVVIHDLGLHHESPYMVLEYLEGTSLRQQMKMPRVFDPSPDQPAPSPAMPLARIIELMVPVLQALICAHEHNIIHCDLKPENIFLTSAGGVKVLDFGIAQAIADTVNLNRDGHSSAVEADRAPRILVGTPLYMSPEQWGAGQVDNRSDIWAIGMLLYEMAAGRHPLLRLPPAELPARVADPDWPVPSIGEAVQELGAFADLVDDCLRKRKEERIQSVGVLLERLQSLSSGVLPDAGPGPSARSRPGAGASAAGSEIFLLELCDLDVTRCETFERARITERESRRDIEAIQGYRQTLQARASRKPKSQNVARLRDRLDRWMRCMPGEPRFRRRKRDGDAVVLLITVRNISARQALIHTLEVDLFARDWLFRGLPVHNEGPSMPTRLLEPMADYALDVQEPGESIPMIPSISVAPDDFASFRVKLEVDFRCYSLRIRLRGSGDSRVESRAIHVW